MILYVIKTHITKNHAGHKIDIYRVWGKECNDPKKDFNPKLSIDKKTWYGRDYNLKNYITIILP